MFEIHPLLHKGKHEHMRRAELRRDHKRIRIHLQTVECKGVVPNLWAAEVLKVVRDCIKLRGHVHERKVVNN
jgi:TolB-like protein